MKRNRIDREDFSTISEELQISVTEVSRAVNSFFGIVVQASRKLPFNTERKIYSKDKFDEYSFALNIPGIGRIGPVYSRYLTWRANESKYLEQEPRRNYRKRITQADIEKMAEMILEGNTPCPVRKRKGNEMYKRVWLVGQEGKTLARQVIPKKKEDGI